jgi:hypothetical protein
VFHYAETETAANDSRVYSALESSLDGLEATSRSWFDETSQSVKARRAELTRIARLAHRVISSIDDPTDSADLQVLAENLIHQAKELEYVERAVSNSEYESNIGVTAAVQFTSPLSDESRTASRFDTDWDMFMAVEPREFVAANMVEPKELQIRAFAFMDQMTSGQGLSRKAKVNLTNEFISLSQQILEKESK